MDNKIRNSFEILTPTEEQSVKMWNSLEKSAVPRKNKVRIPRRAVKTAVTFAMLTVIIFSLGTITNAITGGKVVETIKEVLGIKQASQSVSGQAVNVAERGIEVWAPDIYGIDESHIIFGTKRGVVVYDRMEGGISAEIDTQKIGCIYFDSDSKNSHVLPDGENIVIFNSENGVPYGSYYVYNVNTEGEPEAAEGNDKATLENYYAKWQAHQRNYTDTFAKYHESDWYKELSDKMGDMYGRRALMWNDSYNFFIIRDNSYILCIDDGEMRETALDMTVLYATAETEPETLPMFVYSGEDKAVAAICQWFAEKAERHAQRGEIWVPGFIIRHETDKRGEHLVFGNFWSYGYLKNGNMMESSTGGEMPACFHLKETAEGYEVVSVDTARDGSYYAKDIKAFTRGYIGLANRLMNNDPEARKAAAAEYMAMYVRDNGLDVKYIKEYGWDPIPIFE